MLDFTIIFSVFDFQPCEKLIVLLLSCCCSFLPCYRRMLFQEQEGINPPPNCLLECSYLVAVCPRIRLGIASVNQRRRQRCKLPKKVLLQGPGLPNHHGIEMHRRQKIHIPNRFLVSFREQFIIKFSRSLKQFFFPFTAILHKPAYDLNLNCCDRKRRGLLGEPTIRMRRRMSPSTECII